VRRRPALVLSLYVALAMCFTAGAALGSDVLTSPKPPPPTPVPPFGSPSPYPTALRTPDGRLDPPPLGAAAAVLMDANRGQVLFRHNPHTRRAVASLTKIMTAMLVLEDGDLTDRVTVSARAASQSGSVLGLEPGERISVENLLYALMLQSSNDAAVALAEHVSGSVGRFVKRMNRRARELGLTRTRFASPNGLDDDGRSTAADLARLTLVALDEPELARIVQSKRRDIPAPAGPDRHIQNRNALLWLYPAATGVKTGFTSAAGHCLVATGERDGRRLVAVVLGVPGEAFSDGAALLNYGFQGFVDRDLVSSGEPLGTIQVSGRQLPVEAAASLRALLPTREANALRRRVVPVEGLRAPVTEGRVVGRLRMTAGGRVVGAVDVVASAYLARPPLWELPPEELDPAGRTAQVFAVLVRSVAGAFL
jgi:serine-type D-Ala-D-Ala carboxypeptidase (penicillin-binding protein 5/6)